MMMQLTVVVVVVVAVAAVVGYDDDALDELCQVEELERTLYGEQSTQLGKTYKVIGTIYLLSKNHDEAK